MVCPAIFTLSLLRSFFDIVGEALYRFLLSQASSPPTFLLHCRGTHQETRTRTVTSSNNHGRVRQRSETYIETVVDFDFKIDVGRNVPAGSSPVHWSVPDSEPAYRGRMVREVEVTANEALVLGKSRRKALKPEVQMFKAWQDERTERGLPPWVGSESRWQGHADSMVMAEGDGLRSSRTLRSWADEYCASPKHLKEFTYHKVRLPRSGYHRLNKLNFSLPQVVYGWNFDTLKSAIRTAIASTPYTGNISVSFEYTSNKICVRPDNRLSRILSNPWLKFLMFITLVYPFIWLYKRFHPRGGGKWKVCGGAYSLKPLVQAREQRNPDWKSSQPEATSSAGGSTGVVGLKEGQWLHQWEDSIKRAVASHLQTSVPLTEQIPYRPNRAALLLDGYTDAE